MDNNKRKKSFWYTVAAVACIVIYMLIPLLKIVGIIESYNTGVTSFLVVAGAVIYIAGKKADADAKKAEENDDPSKHFENTEVIEETKDGE